MNKVVVGTAIGIAVGYIARKVQERPHGMSVADSLTGMAHDAKRQLNNVVDKGRNEAEYLRDQVEYEMNK